MATRRSAIVLGVIGLCAVALIMIAPARTTNTPSLPAATADEVQRTAPDSATAILAGGCFWGVEAVFEHVVGVISVVSGYSGGEINAPNYELVSTGTTGHAESVRVTYDPSKVTYGTLLRVFFSVAHDPTQLNRQGPDRGPQYRSAIFATNAEQLRIARAYVSQLRAVPHAFKGAIVTAIEPAKGFYPAESYHQDYLAAHPYSPYILINDAPKVARLKKTMPSLYRD